MWIVLSFVACFLSAVAAVYRKSGIEGQDPFWYGAISLTVTTITIFLIGIMTGNNGDLFSMPERVVDITLVSGIIQGLSWLTYMFAIYYIDVSKVAALDKFNIVATMLFAYVIIDEKISRSMLIGTMFLIFGTLLVVDLKKETQDISAEKKQARNKGIFWGIVSPILMALSNVVAKMDNSSISPIATTSLRILIVTVVLWGFFIFRMKKEKIEFVDLKMPGINMRNNVISGVLTGIFNVLMYIAIEMGMVSVVTAIVKSSVLFTVVLAGIFLHESLTKKGWVGIMLILNGLVILVI
ncbi:EamA-like transporter family protein [Pseudobutyrivibrio sp. ACV-2]|uniref:EamA family transporter n=1 Tax=Pseudobutyrivibrio sp. ACV-2 TaxID=1520801 RepID=UPI000894A47B|nr:EamA family transporter [Pseudobutyrivibrio sp. ACV-2]MCR4830606.1 EamA family transporter [Pseudobutyrivibrio sp.]SEA40612.1 EamA-like transporter family protein [Pseudobutyrivibrio sp. ACV-2]